MAEADWTYLNDGLDIATVDRGVTAGIARPPGGGSFLYAFNSLSAVEGAASLLSQLVFTQFLKTSLYWAFTRTA